MPLNPSEALVLITKTMRMPEKESLAYLEEKGHKLSKTQYYRIWARINGETRKRLYEICKNFKEHHLQHIDTFRTIQTELWESYRKPNKVLIMEKEEGLDERGQKYTKTVPKTVEVPLSQVEKTRILHEIKELIPFISGYEEATKYFMEDKVNELTKGGVQATQTSSEGIPTWVP